MLLLDMDLDAVTHKFYLPRLNYCAITPRGEHKHLLNNPFSLIDNSAPHITTSDSDSCNYLNALLGEDCIQTPAILPQYSG